MQRPTTTGGQKGGGSPGSVSGVQLWGYGASAHTPHKDKDLPWCPSSGGGALMRFSASVPLPRCWRPCRPHSSSHHHSSQEHQRGGRDLGGDHGVCGQCQVGPASTPPPTLTPAGAPDLQTPRRPRGIHKGPELSREAPQKKTGYLAWRRGDGLVVRELSRKQGPPERRTQASRGSYPADPSSGHLGLVGDPLTSDIQSSLRSGRSPLPAAASLSEGVGKRKAGLSCWSCG